MSAEPDAGGRAELGFTHKPGRAGTETGGEYSTLEPLHRNNLHFTEGFLSSRRYKGVTEALQGVTGRMRDSIKTGALLAVPFAFQTMCLFCWTIFKQSDKQYAAILTTSH